LLRPNKIFIIQNLKSIERKGNLFKDFPTFLNPEFIRNASLALDIHREIILRYESLLQRRNTTLCKLVCS